LDAATACGDGQGACTCQDSASDDAEAIAEGPTGRPPDVLGRDHRPTDAEQAGDLFRRAVDAAAIVLDEVAAPLGQLADLDQVRANVESVVGNLLQHQSGKDVRGDASLLGEALDVTEAGPVLALEFQIRRGCRIFKIALVQRTVPAAHDCASRLAMR
jgi:hypothetical protein